MGYERSCPDGDSYREEVKASPDKVALARLSIELLTHTAEGEHADEGEPHYGPEHERQGLECVRHFTRVNEDRTGGLS